MVRGRIAFEAKMVQGRIALENEMKFASFLMQDLCLFCDPSLVSRLESLFFNQCSEDLKKFASCNTYTKCSI